MIIQVRGTSGSGKSTVIRQVMGQIGICYPIHAPGRKRPACYYNHVTGAAILGHYESPCGGCDTLGSAAKVYNVIKGLERNRVILCEGLLLSEDTKWTLRLRDDGEDLRIIFLTTPLDECLQRIAGRRAEAGNDKPLNPSNTANRVAVIERARVKLKEAGIYCRRASSRQAPEIILNWLGVL